MILKSRIHPAHFILGANQISSNSIASGFAVKHDNLRIQPKPKSAPYADVIFSPTAKYKIEQLVLEDMNNKQQPSLQVGINMTVSTLEKCRYSVTSSSELSQVASKWSKRESNKFPFLELQSEYDLYHMQNPDCFQTTGSILVQFFDPDFPIFHISFDSKTNNNHVVIQQRFASAQGPHKIGADVDDGVGATDSSSSGSVDSRHLTLAGGGSFSMRAPFANNNNNSPKSEWSYDDLLKLELIPNI